MKENLINQRFGRLTVISPLPAKSGRTMWLCKCDCGNQKAVTAGHLKSGHTTSCGCYNRQRTVEANTTHGWTGSRLHNIWFDMKARCGNPNCPAYKDYGGRGIKICEDWQNNFASFRDWAMLSGYNDTLSIDRINVNGDYSPDNCRWATRTTQNRNTRQNRIITINGESMTLSEWAELTGMQRQTIAARIDKLGWSQKDAVTKPLKVSNL